MKQDVDRPVGAHAPVAGGLAKGALPYVDATGAQAVQVFVSNPRGWALTEATHSRTTRSWTAARSAGFPPSCTPRTWSTWARRRPPRCNAPPPPWRTGCAEARRSARAAWCSMPVRRWTSQYAPTALRQVREALLPLLDAAIATGGPRLLVEPTAGGGRCLAARVEDLGPYFEAVDWHPGLGVCFDTCHIWAAGHDLAVPGGMTATLDALVALVGPGRLALIHANDSRDPCGSLRDRHETIGAGGIGAAAFAEMLRHPATLGVPVVVETPSEGHTGHSADIATLIRLRTATCFR